MAEEQFFGRAWGHVSGLNGHQISERIVTTKRRRKAFLFRVSLVVLHSVKDQVTEEVTNDSLLNPCISFTAMAQRIDVGPKYGW